MFLEKVFVNGDVEFIIRVKGYIIIIVVMFESKGVGNE